MSSIDKQAYLNATPMQREVVRRLLCDVLGCLRAQYLSYQTSHWQVKGGTFYGNHLLFERLYLHVGDQVDSLAEKLVGYLGSDAVSINYQMRHIAEYTYRWSQIDCNHKRGLQSEADLQAALKLAYEGIKKVKAMTLGLDDWIMATANAHEENEYLLQQALAPIPGQKQARSKSAGAFTGKTYGDFAVGGQDFTVADYEADYDTGVVTLYLERYDRGDIIESRALLEDFEDEVKDVVQQSTSRHVRDWLDKSLKSKGIPKQFKRWKVYRDWSGELKGFRVASMTAEDDFYDNPEKKEVLEFAQSGAISNSVEISEAAAHEDHLDVSEQEAVAEAEEAPPTPTEIAEEPGGSAVSTLNRFVVKTEDPEVEPAAVMNEDRIARLVQQFASWNLLPNEVGNGK